jgi:hypothetical protein
MTTTHFARTREALSWIACFVFWTLALGTAGFIAGAWEIGLLSI